MSNKQVIFQGNNIYISNTELSENIQVENVFSFTESKPTINVYEDNQLKRSYIIETLKQNPDLTGQFFHSAIRVLKSRVVMIDGVLSKNKSKFPSWQELAYEAIRFQPFFLSDKEFENINLKGKGLFERGLHFHGIITNNAVRAICVCDNCRKSFTLQHFHAGFSEAQYFYSGDSKQTLIVKYYQIKNMPEQGQAEINLERLATIEEQLPKPTIGKGVYKYYNSFRCPHCGSVFIDFENNKNIRLEEYYGYYLINNELQHIANE
jgi:hypothetical protein